ncbi:replication endonuclease [Pasteurellaceae bacterium TAE3-ERU1]|nr:replication endonuclease [Pasteurellaceae bacterium TAE3-ERU1]
MHAVSHATATTQTAHPRAVDFRREAFFERNPNPTQMQIALFETNADDYDLVEKWLCKLPRKRQREHFRKLYVNAYKAVKNDGSIAFKCGNKQRKAANTYLREVLFKRLNLVLDQYDCHVAQFSMQHYREPDFDENAPHKYTAAIKRQINKFAKQPFYLIPPALLEDYARTVASIIEQNQVDFMKAKSPEAETLTPETEREIFLELYQQCGEFCLKIGFPIPHWEKAKTKKGLRRLKGEKLDTALSQVADAKYWLRRMRTTQKRMVEHIAIACGEVQKRTSAYVSHNAFAEHKAQVKKNYDFLRAMILENVADPKDQAELLDMYLKSNSNPALRRQELMTRLNGLETWAEYNGWHALFVTLTAPSSFHAQLHNGAPNPKYNGASPRHTQAHLNKVWVQVRAIFAQRKIKFFGMRCAEPHHDATPHWHMLMFVRQECRDEVAEVLRRKGLEVDGDEKGAAEHRVKVEDCDKSKGSATGYITKYISKNIDGYALKGEISDEVDDMPLRENASRSRAWASLWNIRQFQFYGDPGVSIWRELRRLVEGEIKDKAIKDTWFGADLSDYAWYIDKQGGAGVPRADRLIKLHYETTSTNKYGQPQKRIVGIAKNGIAALGDFIKTRKKKWIIKKRPNPRTERDNVTDIGALARPWTCVSNCNSTDFKQSIKNELNRLMFKVTDHHVEHILSGKRLYLTQFESVTLKHNMLITERHDRPRDRSV